MSTEDHELTRLLHDVADGSVAAREELLRQVYGELKAMARARAALHPSVDATELVSEAYIRLFGKDPIPWESRRHFFGVAARAMRDIIVELGRRRQAVKRGGNMRRVPLDSDAAVSAPNLDDALALDTALEKLKEISPMSEEVAVLRYYAGLTLQETASALEIPVSAVRAEWKYAQAFLHSELETRGGSSRGAGENS